MATAAKTRPAKIESKKPGNLENSNHLSFQGYVINEFKELKSDIRELRSETKNEIRELRSETKNEIRDLRSEIKSNLKWTISVILTVSGILVLLITYLHNDNKQAIQENRKAIQKNTQAIHSIDKKLDTIIDRLSAK